MGMQVSGQAGERIQQGQGKTQTQGKLQHNGARIDGVNQGDAHLISSYCFFVFQRPGLILHGCTTSEQTLNRDN